MNKVDKILALVLGILVVIASSLGYALYIKETTKYDKYIVENPTLVKTEDVQVEYGSTVIGQREIEKLLVDSENSNYTNFKLTTDILVTDSLGEKEIEVELSYGIDSEWNSQKETITLTYTVVDTVKPTLSGIKNLSIIEGNDVDFSTFKSTDNVDGNLEVKISGDYNKNKVGTYKLTATSTDSSGNAASSEFTLTVKAEPVTVTYSGGVVTNGKSFKGKLSRFGVNCSGCSGESSGSGGFASGVKASIYKGVRQSNGTWKKGITYDGYYIVAADSSIPLCTVLQFTNHSISGSGISKGATFYAVVLDRGGAIKGNRIDFYIGDENNYKNVIKYNGSSSATVTIKAYGKKISKGCSLPSVSSLS